MKFILRITLCSLCLSTAIPGSAANPQQAPQAPKPPTITVLEKAPPISTTLLPLYSKDAYVIQKLDTRYVFHSNGTWERTITAAIRVQSQAGIQAFGNLATAYAAANQHAEFSYVRVRKPDGTVIETPAANVQDQPATVTVQAPLYSDLHVKQIPVTGLNPGDTLEYQMHSVEDHAEIPNQFWTSMNFVTEGIVLEEHVEIRVPAGKYVHVVSATVQPTIHQEGNEKVYAWTTGHLTEPDANAKPAADAKPSIQLTSFQSWQQLGEWYRTLLTGRADVTPAILQQSRQITAGLTTDDAKQRALYAYASTQFRYIGLSFGIGRLQPHTADIVLQNKFGDCKDKHTLFAALMQAAGYTIWPALISANSKLDPDMPSPAQFNHVISVLPEDKQFIWLDTTEEVAPFGMLASPLRDKLALVLPAKGAPRLVQTPAQPPFPEADNFTMKATLDPKAVLTGHADLAARGDWEWVLRAVFHATPRENWNQLGQRISGLLGFGGTVSNLQADDPDNTAKPFHMAYDYTRKDYGGSDSAQITPPLPPVRFLLAKSDKPPVEPIPLGAIGQHDFLATVVLPKGYAATLVPDKTIDTDFAEYRETSSFKDGTLTAERSYTVKMSKLPIARWDEYLNFMKAVQARENLMVQLAAPAAAGASTATDSNPKAYQLLQQAYQDMQQHKLDDAKHALDQARALSPTQWDLWTMDASLHRMQNDPQAAIESLYLEIANHPGNDNAALALGEILMWQKQYAEAVIFTKMAAESKDADPDTRMLLGEAEIRAGQKDAGIADLETALRSVKQPIQVNNAAYELAAHDADFAEAQQYVAKALLAMETAAGKTTLTALTNQDFARVTGIAETWDTVGWLDFKQSRYAEAESYVQASWTLDQHGSEADHLGQIYEKESKPAQAAHMYRLALAAGNLEDAAATQQRLDALSPGAAAHQHADPLHDASVNEMNKLRTVPMPGHPGSHASAEFFLLIGSQGVEDVQFIKGAESLRSAATALRKGNYGERFPDSGPEKIVRRGIYSCFADTAECNVVLLPPQTARVK